MVPKKMALLCLLPVVSGKVVTGTAMVSPEAEMLKFAYPPGANHRIEIDLEGKSYRGDLGIYAFSDDVWNTYVTTQECREKMNWARWKAPVAFRKNNDGKSSFRTRRVVTTKEKKHPTNWYFLLADCTLAANETKAIHYKIEAKAQDGSHLPSDERGLGKFHFWNFIFSAAGFLWLFKKVWRSDVKRMHLAVLITLVALFSDGGSSLAELVHVTVFEWNGVGSYFFDALSAMIEATCDFVIAFLFLCVGAGWTLRGSMSDDSPYASKTSFLAPVARVLKQGPLPSPKRTFTFWLLHLALAQWSRTYSDDFDTFHDYSHPPGRVLVCMRLALGFFIFLPIVFRSQTCSGIRLQRFFISFALTGFIWFIHLPLVFFLAENFVKIYNRHKFVTAVAGFIQTISLVVLGALFTGNLPGLSRDGLNYFFAVSTVGTGADNLSSGIGGVRAGGDIRYRGPSSPPSKSNVKLPGLNLKLRVD